MKTKAAYFYLFILLFFPLLGLHAQTPGSSTSTVSALPSSQFDMTGFPQWSKDLRRGEIIAFGSYPFAYFFTTFTYDSYRWATHSWNTQYAPWPIKSAGAPEPTKTQKLNLLGIAAGGAVIIALVDYGILRYKRYQQEKEIQSLPPGTPIIIRKPLYGDGSENSPDEAAPDAKTPDDPGPANP